MAPTLAEIQLQSKYELLTKAAVATHLLSVRGVHAGLMSLPSDIERDTRQRLGPRHAAHADVIFKAAVGALVPSDALGPGSVYTAAFLELQRPASAFDALVAAGTRQAPVGVPVPVGTAGSTAAWLAWGASIPMSRMSFGENVVLTPDKVGAAVAFTRELLKVTEAEPIVRQDLGKAVVAAVDQKLLSADAAVVNTSPAGLLHGVSAAGSGSPSSIEGDLAALLLAVSSTSPSTLRFFASKAGVLSLTQARSTDGAPLYPDLALGAGSTILGIPVILSAAAADNLILVDADGVVTVDAGLELGSTGASALEMSDSPTASSVTPTGSTSLVSMFQSNSVALRAIRFLSWVKGRADAVGFVPLPV